MNNLDSNHQDNLAAENARMAENYSIRTIAESISEDREALAGVAKGEELLTDAFHNRLWSIVDSVRNVPDTSPYKHKVLEILANHQDAIDAWKSIANEYSNTPEVPNDRLQNAVQAYEKLLNSLETIEEITPEVKEVDRIRKETQQLVERQIDEIAERANSASPKVKERVLSRFMPKSTGRTHGLIIQQLYSMQNDFYHMLHGGSMEDIRNNSYPDWTDDEIREFYQVLYGEEME